MLSYELRQLREKINQTIMNDDDRDEILDMIDNIEEGIIYNKQYNDEEDLNFDD